ncbi:hypothetical protein [Brevibacillus marinus]|nr:hypothetical protein [Brevibacillus marinus]
MMWKKVIKQANNFLASVSALNLSGKCCTGHLHEPKPPHLRESK